MGRMENALTDSSLQNLRIAGIAVRASSGGAIVWFHRTSRRRYEPRLYAPYVVAKDAVGTRLEGSDMFDCNAIRPPSLS